MSLSTTRLAEILNQLASTGVADSTDVIAAITELAAIATGGDTGSTNVTALQAQVNIVSTTALLEDVTDAINTTNKTEGKMVWNSTTGLPVWADGAAAADTWSAATGIATHSPV